ncbi:MAG: hypothetical protein U0992_24600 [Planctomycetaceae bacterium]
MRTLRDYLMFLEVTGVSTANKGAELMLQAILEHYAPAADVHFAVLEQFGSQRDRARYGLRTKLTPPESVSSRRARVVAALRAQFVRPGRGLVAESEIAAVVDASGFAFSDQLGQKRGLPVCARSGAVEEPGETGGTCRSCWDRRGDWCTFSPECEWSSNMWTAFMREPASLAHLQDLVGDSDKVRMGAGFHVPGVRGTAAGFRTATPPSLHRAESPHDRKVVATERQQYIPFLAARLRELERRDGGPTSCYMTQRSTSRWSSRWRRNTDGH